MLFFTPGCDNQLTARLQRIIPTTSLIIPERAIKTFLSTAGLYFCIAGRIKPINYIIKLDPGLFHYLSLLFYARQLSGSPASPFLNFIFFMNTLQYLMFMFLSNTINPKSAIGRGLRREFSRTINT